MSKSTFRFILAGALVLSILASVISAFGRLGQTPEISRSLVAAYGRIVFFTDAQLVIPQILFSILWLYGITGLFLGWRFSRECFLLSSILFIGTFFTRKLYLLSALGYVATMLKVAATTVLALTPYLVPPAGFYRKRTEQSGPDNPRPCGTSGMSPADPAARAGDTPEASGGI